MYEVDNPKKLNLITSKGNGLYTLYEDKEKEISKTIFENKLIDKNTLQLSINFVKSNKVFNENRAFVFDYVDLKDADIKVFVNGIESNDFKILYSENLRFELPVDNKSKYLIKITFEDEDRFNEIKDNLKRILYSIDVTAKDKYGLYDQILKNPKNIDEITKAIKESKALNKSQKIRLLEVSMSIE